MFVSEDGGVTYHELCCFCFCASPCGVGSGGIIIGVYDSLVTLLLFVSMLAFAVSKKGWVWGEWEVSRGRGDREMGYVFEKGNEARKE